MANKILVVDDEELLVKGITGDTGLGYKVIGLHMKTENQETAEQDEQRVKDLCKILDIECVVVDYADHMQIVKDYFVNTSIPVSVTSTIYSICAESPSSSV